MIAHDEKNTNRRVLDAKTALTQTSPPAEDQRLDGATVWSMAGIAFAGGLVLGLTRSARPLAMIAMRLVTDVLVVATSTSNPHPGSRPHSGRGGVQ